MSYTIMHRTTLASLIFLPFAAAAQFPDHVAEGFPSTANGYYFITTSNFGGTPLPMHGVILDGAGHVAYRKTAQGMSAFRAWPDGRMSHSSSVGHLILDSTFAVIDTVNCANGIATDQHDLRILDNGHYLLLGMETLVMDLSGYAVFPPGSSPGSATAQVKCNVIQELDENEDLVWEWHLVDHFDFLEVDPARLTDPNVVDWSHCNAVDLDQDGNVLLSCRHFNEVIKIDRSTGEVIWHLGGASNEFTFTNDQGFVGQHDVRRLPNGNITLFDNGLPGTHPCRGVEYELDEMAMTATLVWERAYGAPAFSRALGSVQRRADGSTVIGWGAITPDNVMFSTYAQDGTQLNELRFVDTLSTYRATFFDDLPFTLARPVIACTTSVGSYQVTADAGWSSYAWSTGATGPSITAALGDTLWVEVPAGPGTGWLRSEPLVVGPDCLFSGMEELAPSAIDVHPNPAHDAVVVLFGEVSGPHTVELFDAMGRMLESRATGADRLRLSLEQVPGGMLLLRVDGRTFRIVKD